MLARTFQLTQELLSLSPGDDYISLITSWASSLDAGAAWIYELNLPAALYPLGSVSIHESFAEPAAVGVVEAVKPYLEPEPLTPVLSNGASGGVTCEVRLPGHGPVVSAHFLVEFSRQLTESEAALISQEVRLASVAIHSIIGPLLRDEALRNTPQPVLTPRQLQCMRWAAEGYGDKAVSEAVGIGERTVRHHLNAVYAALGVSSRHEAIKTLMLWGWLRPR